MEWISIEDELPEYGTYVLLYKDTWHRGVIGYREKTDKNGHHYQLERNRPLLGTGDLTTNITHWAPLPEIPNKD